MSELESKTVLVYDHGLFFPLAQRLAEEFGRVLYYMPWEEGFSKINKAIVGDGYDNIERVRDIWKYRTDVDCFVFPDVSSAGLQLELERQGYPVWGSRKGVELELDRELFLRTLDDLNLDVPEHEIIQGMTRLREYLKDKEDKYIKISRYRGMQETAHWRSWKEDEGMLDLWSIRWGPVKEHIPFLVFDAIHTDLELGADTYCIDGQWPSLMINGLEHKDKGYIGSVTETREMPEELKHVFEAFGPFLKGYRYRNQWSSEVRVTEDKCFFIDPTQRGGLPSSGSQMELWKNFPEIIYEGAKGNLIDPEPAGKFSAECVLKTKVEKMQWAVSDIPEKIKRWVKFSGCCRIDDRICFPPDETHDDEIGWLVAIGDTLEEAITNVLGYAKELPEGVWACTESLAELLKEAQAAEDDGIKFSKESIPEPSIVLENE